MRKLIALGMIVLGLAAAAPASAAPPLYWDDDCPYNAVCADLAD